MVRLHFTRALLAAFITLSIAPAAILVIELTSRLAKGRMISGTTLERFTRDLPRITAIFGMLLLMTTVLMAVLWLLPTTRRWFQRSWVAGIAGAACGLLLTWPWAESFSLILPHPSPVTWEKFIEAAPILLPFAAISAGLFAFLHAFFVNRAVAKEQWLADLRRDAPSDG
jgi:phosphate/sulfate permease